MENETNQEDYIASFEKAKSVMLPEFIPQVVSFDTLFKELRDQEEKYLQAIMTCLEESRLADENTSDLDKLPKETREAAIRIAMDIQAKGDPDYFAHHNVDKSLMKPIMQVRTVLTKAQEAEKVKWDTTYRARLCGRLRDYIWEKSRIEGHPAVRQCQVKLTLLGRLKALFLGVVYRNIDEV